MCGKLSCSRKEHGLGYHAYEGNSVSFADVLVNLLHCIIPEDLKAPTEATVKFWKETGCYLNLL